MTELFVNAFIQVRIWDILDVILVGLLFYGLYYLVKGTTAIKIFFGIVAIILILKVVTLLHMELLSYIFGAFVNVGIIALIIIFQPEVRRFLLSIGNTKIAEAFKNLFVRLGFRYKEDSNSNLDAICEACASMSQDKVGALILLTQDNNLSEIVETGVKIDAIISKPLLENIFFKNSPLHDGAMVIANNKIEAARCILPITQNINLPGSYGLRHRAGIGITENSDCIAIVVSEETGSIRIIKSGRVHDVKASEMKAKIKELSKKDVISIRN
ncbi:MAG: TIGR00159 family protein [Lentimicrobiaceae bacterium]|nr:TIGR00159 family protein [Lentimicrobiaceae bacterium]